MFHSIGTEVTFSLSFADGQSYDDDQLLTKRRLRLWVGDALSDNQSGPRIRIVEALWDHITDDYDELAFEAGERLVVVDSSDEFWWYGTYLEQVSYGKLVEIH